MDQRQQSFFCDQSRCYAGGGLLNGSPDTEKVTSGIKIKGLLNSPASVTTVDRSKRALELLSLDRNVHMLITDYCMPEMTGFDLLKRVKESAELKEIPVVLMSSENSPTRIRRCLEEGAEDFLIKPVRPSDVSRLCSRVMK